MAEIQVVKGEVSVSLTLNEEEALYVLGVLGHGTGPSPEVYSELYDAMRSAGFDNEMLRGASDKYSVLA